jgi:acyl-coenzyme A synthetase/AMP-(fatty) acid ligase
VISKAIRAALADDPELGAGNVLPKLREHGVPPGEPAIAFDTSVGDHPAWTPLTVGDLCDQVAARASWLHHEGIEPRDPVAVYTASAADCLLSFLALNWLGAIPALINANVPGEIAAAYIRRLNGTGVLADQARLASLREHGLDLPLVADAAEAGSGSAATAPPPYRYAGADPVAITHSSGTTRTPAAVAHSHDSLFAATRELRLCGPRAHGQERVLSVLPAAHSAGILTLHQALCVGAQLLFLSGQGGPPGRAGETVLDAIERWRPTSVYGFAASWSELARLDLTGRALDSVEIWFNTGDCAHEPHIRHLVAAGSHPAYRDGRLVRVPGSRFIDGVGSTEMGYSGFRITHTPESTRYDRCVGMPHTFAEVALLDPSTGAEVPDGQVGHVGFRSPTISLGYWNDSVNTFRTRRGGYYLTGDLMYRDADGYYYHVDRAVDAVDLGGGDWLYTAQCEERILARCPDVRDCSVISGPVDQAVVTDILLMLTDQAKPDEDRTSEVLAAVGSRVAETVREVRVVADDDLVTGPTGKVRKFLMRQRHLAGAAAR